jgi:HK97 family phage prohead protease
MRNAALLLREATALETRDAAMRPRTFDASANTIEAVIATDNPVPRTDMRGPYLESLDIAGANLDALRGASVLDAHRQDAVAAVLGTVDEAWREGAQLVARIRLSGRPEVAAIVEDVRAGVLRSLSIGYEVAEWRDGTSNGQRTRTAVKWSPREVSFVPVAADPRARTRSAESPDRQQRDAGPRPHRIAV